MEEAADLPFLVEGGGDLLETPHQHHLAVKPQHLGWFHGSSLAQENGPPARNHTMHLPPPRFAQAMPRVSRGDDVTHQPPEMRNVSISGRDLKGTTHRSAPGWPGQHNCTIMV